MTDSTTTTRDLPADGGGLISCPLCHASPTSPVDASGAGWWRCPRCGQSWDHARLAIVRDYAIGEHERDTRVAAAMRVGPRLVPRRA
jgi:ribosomal protein L37AE/L43A